MSETTLIKGLIFKPPHEKAPDFVLMRGSMHVADMREFLAEQEGDWVNFDIKKSKAGKLYAAVDDWKPTRQADAPVRANADAPAKARKEAFGDDIPF